MLALDIRVQLGLIALGASAIAAVAPTVIAIRTKQSVNGALAEWKKHMYEESEAREKATSISSHAKGVLQESNRQKLEDQNFKAGQQSEKDKQE